MNKTQFDTYSIFVLHENETWTQPSFRVPKGTDEKDIEKAALERYQGFLVVGLALDPDAPSNVEALL